MLRPCTANETALQSYNKRPLMSDPPRTSTARVPIRISRFISLSILYWRRYIFRLRSYIDPIGRLSFSPFSPSFSSCSALLRRLARVGARRPWNGIGRLSSRSSRAPPPTPFLLSCCLFDDTMRLSCARAITGRIYAPRRSNSSLSRTLCFFLSSAIKENEDLVARISQRDGLASSALPVVSVFIPYSIAIFPRYDR